MGGRQERRAGLGEEEKGNEIAETDTSKKERKSEWTHTHKQQPKENEARIKKRRLETPPRKPHTAKKCRHHQENRTRGEGNRAEDQTIEATNDEDKKPDTS